MYEVKQDFALADFIVTKCKRDTYRRGCAFYELTYKKEDVHDRKEIIVWDKVLLNYQSTCNILSQPQFHAYRQQESFSLQQSLLKL